MDFTINSKDIANYIFKNKNGEKVPACIQNASIDEAKQNLREIQRFQKLNNKFITTRLKQLGKEAAAGGVIGATIAMPIAASAGFFMAASCGPQIRRDYAREQQIEEWQMNDDDLGEVRSRVIQHLAIFCAVAAISSSVAFGIAGAAIAAAKGVFEMEKLNDEHRKSLNYLEKIARRRILKLEKTPSISRLST